MSTVANATTYSITDYKWSITTTTILEGVHSFQACQLVILEAILHNNLDVALANALYNSIVQRMESPNSKHTHNLSIQALCMHTQSSGTTTQCSVCV